MLELANGRQLLVSGLDDVDGLAGWFHQTEAQSLEQGLGQ